MTTILNNPPTTMPEQARSRLRIVQHAPQILMRAMIFLCLGAILSILVAWAFGLWADVESAPVITSSVPQRGRMWEISVWNSTGAIRLHSLRQAHSWSGWQVTGPPDSPMNGDSTLAWCPATADAQPEWLILDYPRPMAPRIVQIYENYCPGAVTRVTVFKENGEEVEAWRGQDPTPPTNTAGVSNIRVDPGFKTQRVKIYIDSPKAPGWNEIDAVGLIDEEGNRQWASDVQDSTSYANLNTSAPPPLTLAELVPSWCPLAQPDLAPLQKPQDPSATDDRVFEARGWPMLALWTERPANYVTSAAAPVGMSFSRSLIPRSAPGTLPPILPTRPIWGGLFFNAILYAVSLAIAYWLLVKPRRLILELVRMRHGCCIACGYQLDFDFRSGCPECGWRRSPDLPA
ncbi:MAG TPA: discoidin domain-containing protein [Tepidisphaeraceae bacterium]|nr:discoidin domain-containing protein [Tepidisphaeraceae bacterium]